MSKIVYLDMDGVLVDTIPALCHVHKKPWPYSNRENLGKFDVEEIWGITNTEFYQPLDYSFWKNLPKTHDCSLLLGFTRKHKRYVLSSPSSNPASGDIMAGKRDWLAANLPELANDFIFTKRKEAVAGPGKILIDDSDKFIDAWREAGGIGLLMPRLWNSRHGVALEDFYVELIEALK